MQGPWVSSGFAGRGGFRPRVLHSSAPARSVGALEIQQPPWRTACLGCCCCCLFLARACVCTRTQKRVGYMCESVDEAGDSVSQLFSIRTWLRREPKGNLVFSVSSEGHVNPVLKLRGRERWLRIYLVESLRRVFFCRNRFPSRVSVRQHLSPTFWWY